MKKFLSICILFIPALLHGMGLEEAYEHANRRLKSRNHGVYTPERAVRKALLKEIQEKLLSHDILDKDLSVEEINKVVQEVVESQDQHALARQRAADAAEARNQRRPQPAPAPAPAPAIQLQPQQPEIKIVSEFGQTRRLTGVIKSFHPLVAHLMSEQQTDGVSCGYWSLTNAAAIKQLMDEGAPITSENIKKRTVELKEYMWDLLPNPLRELKDDEISRALEGFGLSTDAYVLGYALNEKAKLEKQFQILPHNVKIENERGELIIPAQDFEYIQARTLFTNEMKKINDDIHRKNAQRVISFICNLGNSHWVLISILKLPGYEPCMLLLNSSDSGQGLIDDRFNDFVFDLYNLLMT